MSSFGFFSVLSTVSAVQEHDLREGAPIATISNKRAISAERPYTPYRAIRMPVVSMTTMPPRPASAPAARPTTPSDDGYTSEDSLISTASASTAATSVRSASPIITTTTKPQAPIASKAPTMYLYQGGKTNVLTGGVMLGAQPRKETKYQAPKRQIAAPKPVVARKPATTPFTAPKPMTAPRAPTQRQRTTPARNSDACDNWRKRN
ncbi:hypothetical protein CYLTODRAFT_416658 [Cylindrobasidium torrendii FP15055 ss-10]|uniref:Uncharacterized protein n=1 Tax=Cylindrobasidium torrendii FP15055 ss-10 TaxID=1314674 RepID=A0A0D7BUB0_9AGAR|nr:hypothetical protein CYLTODRAFT_416658 [Cylindrobasidium torrendii FP15055 ss-10]